MKLASDFVGDTSGGHILVLSMFSSMILVTELTFSVMVFSPLI